MLNSLLLIAQEEAAKPELVLTTSEKLVATVVLVVFCASLFTVVKCFLRWQNGEVVMPVAKRRCLHVPTAVAVIGVVVVTFLASAAMVVSFDELSAVDVERPDAEAEVALVDESAEPEAASKNGEEGLPAAAEQLVEQQRNADDVAWDMILGIISMNGVLLFLFGTLVWLTQADGPGRSVSVSDSEQLSPEELNAEVGLSDVGQVQNLEQSFGDFVGDSGASSLMKREHPATANIDSSAEVTSAAIHEHWNLWVELKFAGLAFLMALVPTMMMRIIVVSLMPEPKSHPFIEMMDGGGLSVQLLVLLMLIATIVAPVVEELLYRVVVLGGLANHRGSKMAIAVSAVLFGCAHGFPDCISLLPLAVILGYTYVQRRSYRTVMLVHLMFNAFNMSLALLQTLG